MDNSLSIPQRELIRLPRRFRLFEYDGQVRRASKFNSHVEAYIESPGRQLYIDKTESIMLSDKSRARREVMLASAVREKGQIRRVRLEQ